jgi:hypothetical protein
MTAKKPARGGRVTPKGTTPKAITTHHDTPSTAPSFRASRDRANQPRDPGFRPSPRDLGHRGRAR